MTRAPMMRDLMPSHLWAARPQRARNSQEMSFLHLLLLKSWSGIVEWDKDDKAVVEWYESQRKAIGEKVANLKAETLAEDVASLVRGGKKAGWTGVRDVLRVMPVEEREEILKYLRD